MLSGCRSLTEGTITVAMRPDRRGPRRFIDAGVGSVPETDQRWTCEDRDDLAKRDTEDVQDAADYPTGPSPQPGGGA